MKYLIVGLGNPGAEFSGTRHNIGFDVVDELIKRVDAQPVNAKVLASISTTKSGAHTVLLMKPRTFMNTSGEAVSAFMRVKMIPVKRLIVVHDELDLPFGTVRVSRNSSAAGHNGVQSVIDTLKTQEFTRVRIGIGPRPEQIPGDKFVLGKFSADERKTLATVVGNAANDAWNLLSN
jgi:PTH1 family peptidyl-tRNA hydrolase